MRLKSLSLSDPLTWLCLILISFVSASTSSAQTCGEAQDLGLLATHNQLIAFGISDDGGVIVGQARETLLGRVGVKWTPTGGVVPIGDAQGSARSAEDCSGDGNWIVGEARFLSSSLLRPYRYSAGTGMQDLLAPLGPSVTGAATGVSDDGQVVVGWYDDSVKYFSFLWTPSGGVQTISPALANAFARAVSGDGTTVTGVGYEVNVGNRGFVWTQAIGFQWLEVPSPGNDSSSAYDLSYDGRVIVGSSSSFGAGGGPVRWVDGVLEFIGSGSGGFGAAVSADGSRVVGSLYPGSTGQGSSFLWSAATGVVDLHLAFGGHSNQAVCVSSDARFVGGFSLINQIHRSHRIEMSPVGTVYCEAATANSTGCVGRLFATGSAQVAQQSLQLEASYLPQGVFGYFLVGTALGGPTVPMNSQGPLCLGGSIGRYNAVSQILNSGTAGEFQLALDLMNMPTPGTPVPVMAGQTWFFQAWHRESNPQGSSNFTQALAIEFE